MAINAANPADINQVLMQMRALRSQAQMPVQSPAGGDVDVARSAESNSAARQVDFGSVLGRAVDSVNTLQQQSSTAANDFIAGRETDIVNVMIQGQKANLGFQSMVQVRNRMISAYQDIMNMPI